MPEKINRRDKKEEKGAFVHFSVELVVTFDPHLLFIRRQNQ